MQEYLGIEKVDSFLKTHQHVRCVVILLLVHLVGHHGCLDCGEHPKLGAQGGDLLADLEEVGPDLLVRAVPGQLLGQLGDPL